MNPRFADDSSPTTGQQAGASVREIDLALLHNGRSAAYGYHVRPTFTTQARAAANQVAIHAQLGPRRRIQTP